jgi:hypothetical protein
MVTKHTLFRATKTETKADSTSTAAKSIIASETSAREAKVERLRKARLEREAFEPKPEAKPARKTTAARTKT